VVIPGAVAPPLELPLELVLLPLLLVLLPLLLVLLPLLLVLLPLLLVLLPLLLVLLPLLLVLLPLLLVLLPPVLEAFGVPLLPPPLHAVITMLPVSSNMKRVGRRARDVVARVFFIERFITGVSIFGM
jgi:hypothetical protein